MTMAETKWTMLAIALGIIISLHSIKRRILKNFNAPYP